MEATACEKEIRVVLCDTHTHTDTSMYFLRNVTRALMGVEAMCVEKILCVSKKFSEASSILRWTLVHYYTGFQVLISIFVSVMYSQLLTSILVWS